MWAWSLAGWKLSFSCWYSTIDKAEIYFQEMIEMFHLYCKALHSRLETSRLDLTERLSNQLNVGLAVAPVYGQTANLSEDDT